ncbi:zinc ribbon domain-containing protein [Streptomyces sp. NBC_00151]|uniref:zinc ribbon domain-containing protein n=1 Tax=Streptomyces sp. NBC_00151 TaxID=2975669 RepID=UPI002DD9C399|nr:zinc ribbon domain-containing protein [Streptomyces sp. NBC_00151]WRZ44583.1 TM2 domain-containing protein [Streptomyces sp. NBC_00151]
MMTDMVNCPHCGAVATQEDSFCAICGRRIRPEGVINAHEPIPVSSPEPAPLATPGQVHANQAEIGPHALYAEYDSRKLTVLTGYVAGVIGFPVGLHRLYAGKPLWWIYLILFILGAIGSFILVGFVFFGVMFIWWIVDMALMKEWVESHNQTLRHQIFNWAREVERNPHSDWGTRVG